MTGEVPIPPRRCPVPLTIPQQSELGTKKILEACARLCSHFQSTTLLKEDVFSHDCFSLARAIDYAVSRGDLDPSITDLPYIMKQVYGRRGETFLQPAVLVLFISIKHACSIGWFSTPESEELLAMAQEISNTFCLAKNVTSDGIHSMQIVSNVISRFYPHMRLGRLFVSLEVQPGYKVLVTDICIARNINRGERIYLFVSQTDNMETSSCIISPPEVNFMVNGIGVYKRANTFMDNGPQYPSDITTMLKYGMNLFQAIGSFRGNYIIVVAVMTSTDSLNSVVLQDYVKPMETMVESDSDIIVGASRISLNCPISFKRITTPVKGHLCKHYQCFDLRNFLNINSRKPSWRCPHCNQHVSYIDIRIDRFMEKILKEAGEVSDIIISVDGTWKPSVEHLVKPSTPKSVDIPDGTPASETTEPGTNATSIVDLTVEDHDRLGTEVFGNKRPSNEFVIHIDSTPESDEPKPLKKDLIFTPGAAHGTCDAAKETFSQSSEPTLIGSHSTDQPTVFDASASNTLASRLEIASQSLSHVGSSSRNTLLGLPASTALDTQLQQSRVGNSTSNSRMPRYICSIPGAQALSAHAQQQALQKRAQTNESRLNLVVQSPGGPSSTLDTRGELDAQLDRAWGDFQASGMASSALLRQSHQNLSDSLREVLRKKQDSVMNSRGGAEAGSLHRIPATHLASRVPLSLGESDQVCPIPPQALRRPAVSLEPPSAQTWRPMKRMRGALAGSEYSAALRHYLEQPSPSPTMPTTASNPLSARSSGDAVGTTPNCQRNVPHGNPPNPS